MPTVSGMQQFRAHFSKNHLEKRRNFRVTFCEFGSHLIVVMLLVLGYSLSTVLHVDEATYSTIQIDVPPKFFNGDPPTLKVNALASYLDGILTQPFPLQSLESYVSLGNTVRGGVAGDTSFISLARQTQLGRRLNNIITRRVIMLAPRGPLVDSLFAFMNNTVPSLFVADGGKPRVVIYESEDAAVQYVQDNPDLSQPFALIVIHQANPGRVNYEIRTPYYMVPNTNRVLNRNSIGLSSRYREYIYSGFLSLQDCVDKWAFEYTGAAPKINATFANATNPTNGQAVNIPTNIVAGVNDTYNPNDIYDPRNFQQFGFPLLPRQSNPQCEKPVPYVMPFPIRQYDNNPFFSRVGYILGMGLVMSTMYPVSRLVKNIVEEKESRMREVMKIMGLVDWAHQLSWFFTGFCLFTWIALSTWYVTTQSFIKNSNKTIIFLYFFLFSVSEAMFAFLLSVFFSNSKIASICAPVALFVCILPRYIFFQSNDEELAPQKYYAALFSPTAFVFGADAIADYEFGGVGLQWDNIDDGAFSFLGCLQMLFVDIILYGLLAVYFDKVLPGEHGIALSPFFFLQRNYWFPVDDARQSNAAYILDQMKEFQPLNKENLSKNDVERIPDIEKCRAQVCLHGLRKRYPDGKLAVKNLSLTMLEGEITCLLGANGAGKTTTIAVLTGLVTSTAGDVQIYGHSLATDLQSIRLKTGICPQHNVLFANLTVEEHLSFFGKIKGLSGTELRQAVTEVIQDVGLTEKRHALSDSLSGGMKRKLSLCIALMGDPKFVLLDEPTSGMDPYSRRSTWELLMRYKKNRVILLTTHFMEEADTLGDRIAIMSEGKLRCAGSSLFLKTRYGAGYILSMARTKESAHAANTITAATATSLMEASPLDFSQAPKKMQTPLHSSTEGEDSKAPPELTPSVVTGQKKPIRGASNDPQVLRVEKVVCSIIPDAYASSIVAGEILFQLPLTATPLFGRLFTTLKQTSKELGVGSYGISITTLEQVFIRLALEAKAKSVAQELRRKKRTADGVVDVLTNLNANVVDVVALNAAIMNEFDSNGEDSDDDDEYDDETWKLGGCLSELNHLIVTAMHRAVVGDVIPQNDEDGLELVDSGAYLTNAKKTSKPVPSSPRRDLRSVADSSVLLKTEDSRSELTPGSESVHPLLPGSPYAATSRVALRSANDTMESIESTRIDLSKVIFERNSLAGSPNQIILKPQPPKGKHVLHIDLEGDDDQESKQHEDLEASNFMKSSEEVLADLVSQDDAGKWNINKWMCRSFSEREQSADNMGISHGTLRVQFWELLKKRWIVAKRDIKGFFFQVLFPTIQIFLVLTILTISWSPAGKTLKFNSEILETSQRGVKPAIVIAGAGASECWMHGPINNINATLYAPITKPNVNTSSKVSQYLLDLTELPKNEFNFPQRWAGLVMNDSVNMNLTVSWPWVRRNLDFILENQAAISAVGAAFGLDVNAATGDLVGGSNSINFVLPNSTALNFTLINNQVQSNQALNLTAAQYNIFRNITNALAGGNSADPASGQDAFNGNTQGTITASRISFNFTSSEVLFTNATLRLGPPLNSTTNLGNVSIPIRTVLEQVLPTVKVAYPIVIPTPYSILHNTTSPHSQAIYNGQLVASAFAQCSPVGAYTAGGYATKSPVYLVKNHPLPVSIKQALETKIVLSVLASLFVLVPLCYIPASFVPFLVKERASKSKHLQNVSGVSPYTYWIATYAWDMMLFLILSAFCMLAFKVYEGDEGIFTSDAESTFAVFALISAYGFAAVPLSYIYSLPFENHSTAQITITFVNFITGFVGTLAILILQALEETEDLAIVLRQVFRAFPPYLIGEGFINLAGAFFTNILSNRRVSYFKWEITGRCLYYLMLEAVGYMGIMLFLETSWFKRGVFFVEKIRAQYAGRNLRNAEKATSLDVDVIEERDRLVDEDPSNYALFIRGLEKVYPPGLFCGQTKYAVRNISFACPYGERFGLLGINGAGKTTTLGILTGDCSATAGEVFVGGFPLSDPATKTLIGYCPQVDPLLEAMNSFETLFFFGRVRGIPETVLNLRINKLIDQVGLRKHAHRPCGTYSGGNKRKLSLAVAMIGEPKVLFLDEPSTGMDPEARRSMWEVIESVSANRSIVLVSHSMEECEALCTRIGIMVSGKMSCLGSTQHIKGRFGAEYQIEIRCISQEGVTKVHKLLAEALPSVVVDETHGGFIRLKSSGSIDLGEAFHLIESNKEACQVLDYSISQATLEQIFIRLARDQEEETGNAKGFSTEWSGEEQKHAALALRESTYDKADKLNQTIELDDDDK